jgi:hypothetical protein
MTRAAADSSPQECRYEHLVARHFDGLLTAEESRALGGLLAGDAERARDFARRAMFHQHARAVLRFETEYATPGHERGVVATRRPWGGRAAAILVAVALGATAIAAATVDRWRSESGVAADAVAADVPFAVMEAAIDAVWSDPNVELVLRHGSLPRGRMTLVSGHVQFVFASGGTAIIEGPATFEPIAVDALLVVEGAVRCRCPREGSELRVVTPSSTITDLGTEFAISVQPGTGTRVAVIEGRVRLDVAEASQFMAAGESLAIDMQGNAREDIGFLKDVAAKAVLAPFDEEAFERAENLLRDTSFETNVEDTDNAGEFVSRSGGFQLGPWRGSLGHVEQISEPQTSGDFAVRLRANGNRFWPLIEQHVGTGDISGRLVLAAVRASQSSSDPLTGKQCAIVKLQFVDAAGRDFAYAERHFLRAGGVMDRFVEGRIAAFAPPGTAAVRCQILVNAHGLSTGSVIADDAVLKITR